MRAVRRVRGPLEAPLDSAFMGTAAWEIAHAAAARAGVILRPLNTVADAQAITAVMIATWGEHQLLPSEVIVALAEAGDVPYGAFDGDELIGYVLGWAGVEPQEGLHLHSHMLAALPSRRHAGVGFALKLAQRAQSLEQGIHVVRWTFDPMIARNAWFNLGKLGAVADRFRRDFYGAMSDTLNAGERSDRLVVRWDLDREPGSRPRADAPADAAFVSVPRDYPRLRDADPAAAGVERDRVAGALDGFFRDGMIAVAFDPETSTYALVPAEVGAS
jgi:predicted GNAT superfamily acetyltransferase